EEKNKVSDSLCSNLANKKSKEFWKIWNSHFKVKKHLSNSVNINSTEITNSFANLFQRNSIPNCTKIHENFKNIFQSKRAALKSDIPITISISDFDEAMRKIGNNSTPGEDNLCIEHLKLAHP